MHVCIVWISQWSSAQDHLPLDVCLVGDQPKANSVTHSSRSEMLQLKLELLVKWGTAEVML